MQVAEIVETPFNLALQAFKSNPGATTAIILLEQAHEDWLDAYITPLQYAQALRNVARWLAAP